MSEPRAEELVSVVLEMDLEWRYRPTDPMSSFLTGLRDRRLSAMRCHICGRRYLPPRPFCGDCTVRLAEWVPVSDEGTIEAWTVVHLPILDGRTGEERPSPYGMALIRLDGADTTVNHFLDVPEGSLPTVGARVRAVWRDELRGAMDDIEHFEVMR